MTLLVELDEMKLLVLGAINSSAPPQAGFLLQQGISLGSYLLLMTLDIQMTLMATSLELALGIEQLGRDVAGEVESDWMVPLLVEEERDRLIGWQLGVSL